MILSRGLSESALPVPDGDRDQRAHPLAGEGALEQARGRLKVTHRERSYFAPPGEPLRVPDEPPIPGRGGPVGAHVLRAERARDETGEGGLRHGSAGA